MKAENPHIGVLLNALDHWSRVGKDNTVSHVHFQNASPKNISHYTPNYCCINNIVYTVYIYFLLQIHFI